MNGVGAFVHLYHIWGILGLATSLFYGRNICKQWRATGGSFRTAPSEVGGVMWHHIKLSFSDVYRLGRAALYRFTGLDYLFAQSPESPWRYGNDHSLLLGIMLGGIARFATAFYWSEINTGWVTVETVWIPAIPIILAVLADISHQATALDNKWPIRWASIAAIVWILWGAAYHPVAI